MCWNMIPIRKQRKNEFKNWNEKSTKIMKMNEQPIMKKELERKSI